MMENVHLDKGRYPRASFPIRGSLLYCACAWLILLVFFHRSFIYGELLSPADLLSQRAVTASAEAHVPGNRLLTDSVYQFMVWQKKGYESLTSCGRVPFIDQDVQCGGPYYCNPQAEVFYLPRQLTPPAVYPRPNAFVHACELFLAGLGIYLLVWALGLNQVSGYFGGLLWMLNGYLIVWKLWPLSAAAWPLSWMLLATVMLLGRGGGTRVWGSILALSVFLSLCGGHPQTTCLILFFIGSYALTLSISSSTTFKGKGVLACRWGIFVVLGIGFSAFFLLPQFLCLTDSFAWMTRVEKPVSLFSFSKSDIVSLPGFFFPEIFGGFRSGELPLCGMVKALNPNELAGGYVGWLIPLVMVPLAFMRRRGIPFFYFWFAWAVISLAVALKLPFVVNLVELIPVVGSIRLTRFIMLSGISFLVLGIYALDSISRVPLSRKTLFIVCLFLAIFAGITLCGAAGFRLARTFIIEKVIVPRQASMSEKLAESPTLSKLAPLDFAKHLETTTVWYSLRCFLVAALAILVFLYAARRREYAYFPLVAVSVFELFCFGYGYTPAIPEKLHYPETPGIAFLRKNLGGERVAAAGEKILPPNVLAYYGLADIRGFDSIGYPPYFELAMKAFKLDRSENAFVRHGEYLHPVSDMLGMKYLVSNQEFPDVKIPDSLRFRRVFTGKGFYIYENTSVLPQAYLAERVVVEPVREKRLEMMNDRKPGERTAVIPSGTAVFSVEGKIELIEKTDRNITIDASLSKPGFLVISILFLPGWSAEVNNQPTVLESTNYAFMGLRLPSGDSAISLSYSPPGLRAGIGISIASLFLLLLFIICPNSFYAWSNSERALRVIRS